MNQAWMDTEKYDSAVQRYGQGMFQQFSAEDELKLLTNVASYDAGFEAGVLASEAGVGRADE